MTEHGIVPTATPWSTLRKEIPFPNEVAGSIILDIGGGQSDAAAALRALGATVYVIDPAYRDLAALDASVDYAMSELQRGWRGAAGKKAWATYEAAVIEGRENWRADIAAHPSSYIAADATNLPLASGSCDFVYSSYLISNCFVSPSGGSFKPAVREAWRVAKPSGRLVLYPVMNTTGNVRDPMTANYAWLRHTFPVKRDARRGTHPSFVMDVL